MTVLDSFPPEIRHATWTPVASGFSGAMVWRSDNGLSLKRWPEAVTRQRLQVIHIAQQKIACVGIVPELIANRDRQTVIEFDGFRWDVSTWRPGQPHAGPWTATAIALAVQAIVDSHEIWCWGDRVHQPPSVVHRRLQLLSEYSARRHSVATEIETAIDSQIERTAERLHSFRDRHLPAHTIWSDLHRDHVLFAEGAVSGLIDFGAVRLDHPGGDLVRLFDDPASLAAAIDAYETIWPGMIDRELTMALGETSAVVNLMAWVVRLNGRTPKDGEMIRIRSWLEKLRS